MDSLAPNVKSVSYFGCEGVNVVKLATDLLVFLLGPRKTLKISAVRPVIALPRYHL